MLQNDKKHHLEAKGKDSMNPSQNKCQRVEELPKEVAAPMLVHLVPDIASSTPFSESDDGDHSDGDDEQDSDGESSAAST